jgi:hypothetical protein
MADARIRVVPTVGASVTVAYLGGNVAGTVTWVGQDLRTLAVDTADGDRVEFGLSPATARFVALDNSRARLLFDQLDR